MSKRVADYIETKKEMPNYVTSARDGNIKMGPFLEMTSRCIIEVLNNNLGATIEVRGIREASSSAENLKEGQLQKEAYKDYAGRVNEYCNSNARAIPYGQCGVGQVSWMETLFIFTKILRWFYNNKAMPNYVTVYPWSYSPKVGSSSGRTKTQLWLDVENALGKSFNTPEELAAILQNHPDYEYYYNDGKKQSVAVAALKVIGKPGNNCVDISQIIRQILIDMGEENVNIWRGVFNCGGHVWVTYGSANKIFDGAGMMKYGYPIGRYMCSGQPWDLVKNPAWAVSDDGVT